MWMFISFTQSPVSAGVVVHVWHYAFSARAHTQTQTPHKQKRYMEQPQVVHTLERCSNLSRQVHQKVTDAK